MDSDNRHARGQKRAPVTAPPGPERPVAIVGAGSIGVGWAIVFARGNGRSTCSSRTRAAASLSRPNFSAVWTRLPKPA